MSAKTKIVVIKLKDVLFYATVGILCIIALLLLFILFQPDTATTTSTIDVKIENMDSNICCCPKLSSYLFSVDSVSSA